MTKVLIVDDEERVRRTLRDLIEKDGYACRTAEDGVDGLAALRLDDFDVVVADLRMPKLDGIGLLAAMRTERIQTMPVVLTGTGEVADAVEAMKLGAFDFLLKTEITSASLRRVVERAAEYGRVLRHSRTMERIAAEWETTFDASPDLMAVLDKARRIVRCNQAMATRLGVSKAAVVGSSCEEILGEADCSADILSASCGLFSDVPHTQEVHSPRLGGDFLVTIAPLRNADGGVFGTVYIARDITERKRAEVALRQTSEQLKTLSRQLLQTQETERRAIARELHDEIGQALTAIKINLQSMQRLPAAAAFASQLEDSISIVDRGLQQVRNLSLDLRPSILDDLGLVAALRWYVDRLSQRANVAAQFAADASLARPSADTETVCFRVAQEALTNVMRHAQARRVSVTLSQEDNALQLRIQDDGVGFDVRAAQERAAHGGSLGLLGMQERVRLVGGQIEIESAPGMGTEIQVRFPL